MTLEAYDLPRARPQKYDPRPWEIVPGVTPVAGANFALTSPGRQGWTLMVVRFRLVTDATVANRSVTVDYDDGNGTIFWSGGMSAVIPASQTATLTFDAERTASESNTNNQFFASLREYDFMPGQALQINVLNKAAGDQLSQIVLTFEREPWAPS